MFNINRTQRTSASEQQSQQQQQHQQQHQQQQHDQSSQLHQETRQPHHQQHQHHQQQLEQSQRNIRSGDDSTPNHSPTSPDQPEVYIRERRHHRNTSCRNRRNQDLSPRFEDDRNIIYLHDGNTRHYRSQNHLNDPSGFWLQRSASGM
ncbi:unnamed protein product [Trichobilharzia regenti]|nr:unnamed protein product [Trichobilharzia regenti]